MERGGSISVDGPNIGPESLWKVFCRKLFLLCEQLWQTRYTAPKNYILEYDKIPLEPKYNAPFVIKKTPADAKK